MFERFQQDLFTDSSLNPKHVPHYIRWVRECYSFLRLPPEVRLSAAQKGLFLAQLEKSREEWQVKQAAQALSRFDFFLARAFPNSAEITVDRDAWTAVKEKARDLLRLKHHALNTERIYLSWLRQFQGFVGEKSPGELTFDDLRRYLSHLAVERNVAASTQNQALNALVFVYRHVLGIETDESIDAVRAKGRRRLPVVLSVARCSVSLWRWAEPLD